MDARQRFALLHPLEGGEDITQYRGVRLHRTGLLLVTILAVDR